ncbi:TIGR03032 family protein [cf. Phormidesmis sp. LEGE 11477]|uniref:TIGR03032 family protein n=1 Tax=cf. Phormidesmis sp. LEGE 11477 TaxID=1828680 RepID=UPI001882DAE4|nr:TIGR03032 family protein [cf. Phormidesmis sp. LEGE 11477]MBE9062990.1 TIGR03032 family protein [cf. Phormidesmis sp. LEGE 11477]
MASAPFRSIYTQSFCNLLNRCGISLIVSTYQAGRVIVVRSEGKSVNTHFRVLNKPMGVAAADNKLAIGTAYEICVFRNAPAVVGRLEPPDRHDACYLLGDRHVTGNIDIHEMAYARDELWFVNTRFSCLCTFDHNSSFVPRWRPPFISGYNAGDRCHLNGLAIKDNQPHYMTALGETNTAQGWRENKADGGILMDITTDEILVSGLSMPHSPRWYRDQLWVLESGQGSLATVNIESGKLNTVVTLPGFARGMDFFGPLAFIGLSQVRESAVFSGLPIVEASPERICGVWVVNIETAEILGFLKFEGDVQEIFSVTVLPGIRFPELIKSDETLLKNSFVLPDDVVVKMSSQS